MLITSICQIDSELEQAARHHWPQQHHTSRNQPILYLVVTNAAYLALVS